MQDSGRGYCSTPATWQKWAAKREVKTSRWVEFNKEADAKDKEADAEDKEADAEDRKLCSDAKRRLVELLAARGDDNPDKKVAKMDIGAVRKALWNLDDPMWR
jgi:hypothetical protein